jgi:hypothetical protein
MRTASPWWASLVFGLGLVAVFVGERLFGHSSAARIFLTGILGLAPVLGVVALRLWTTLRTAGDRRRIERTLLACHLGTVATLALYALTTPWGNDVLGIHNVERWNGALTVLVAIGAVVSIVPVIMIEGALGVALRSRVDLAEGGSDAGLDYLRAREVSWSGLSLAFAVSLLFVTCQVANERNVSRDVSYFKTSAPGESTRNIVAASTDPIKVHLFFPEGNEVKEHVVGYFEALRAATRKVSIESHDRLAETSLATKFRVGKDGVVVLARGEGEKEKFYSLELDTDIDKMRRGSSIGSGAKLRTLDRDVNSQLMKLMRDKRKAYLTVGHGELNNPGSVPAEMQPAMIDRTTTIFRRRLAELNYEVKDLTSMDLAQDVPEDATILFVLAPMIPLMPSEWDSIERYLDRGGRLLFAIDPLGVQALGPLEGRFGLRPAPGRLTDDRNFSIMRRTASDQRNVRTTQFSAHASTTALSRETGMPFFLIEAGALEEVPFRVKGEPPKRTITIRSMDNSWLDLQDAKGEWNFAFDAATEKRQRWNLAAAIEGNKVGDKEGYRALVFSDVDLFRDIRVVIDAMGRSLALMASGPLLDDAVRWLGGEEQFVGDVVSEEDKRIEHTKDKDALWFTITCIGVPLLVLGLGLFGTVGRRKRRQGSTQDREVTP